MTDTSNVTKIIETTANNDLFHIGKLLKIEENELSEKNPDIIIIKSEEKNSIGINQVKKLRQWAYVKPYFSQRKIVIIMNADILTTEAQNSLLKITEEPPTFTHIYLIVENHTNLLPTIISRSQLISYNNTADNSQNNLVTEFLSLNVNQKMKYAEDLHKQDSKHIGGFIDLLIKYSRENLDFVKSKKLLDLKSALKQNVSKRLICENIAVMYDD